MNGILLIDKPSGWTSNDVVQKLRGALHERRIGHAGTLDPMATGLLTVFVGRATRAVEFAESDEKTYLAGLRLGVTTDTQDTTGTVLRTCPVTAAEFSSGDLSASDALAVSAAVLEASLQAFRGTIRQIPPMYSAVQVNGRRLYTLARQGKTVERPPREIQIRELRILSGEGADWTLLVRCSKGTYVRTLCHDIGELLGCGACMSSLRRLEAGIFHLEDAVTLKTALQAAAEGNAESLLIPVERLFDHYPKLTVNSASEKKIRNGSPVRTAAVDGTYRVCSESGEFLALATIREGELRVRKSFFEVFSYE